ncbi:MAG: bacteriohopanetetrol glucosamine biosynthesis glycosyltransferase HpnI [Candidatus Omnitrophica bacterium]|nr:bacteriohopanetetrol glucosamine biosynthesis glycosyltransferase HpnI [Candidatus Omnitrophota bacterium]
MQGVLQALFLIPCLTGIGFYLYSIWAARDLFSEKPRSDVGFRPPVSILKPLCGLERDAVQNLASFCRQEYPQTQIIFGVDSENDPCTQVVRKIIGDFPERDIQMVVCQGQLGTNPKVNNLIQMESRARHPFLLLCDSDIRVGPDYLKRVLRPFADPAVGAVTCMGRSRTEGFPSVLEALRISTEFCPGVLVARKLEGIKFGLGSTIVLRREALAAIGGFEVIADFLADDFHLGALISKAGWKVVLSDYLVEHCFSAMSLGAVIRRQVRWDRAIHVSRPWSYGGLLFTQGIPMSILFLAASAGSAAGWAVLGVTWISRFAMAWGVGAMGLNDSSAKRFLWLVPAQDLLSFGVWCSCFFGDTLEWRGERFRLTRAGKLVPLSLRPAPVYSEQETSVVG